MEVLPKGSHTPPGPSLPDKRRGKRVTRESRCRSPVDTGGPFRRTQRTGGTSTRVDGTSISPVPDGPVEEVVEDHLPKDQGPGR